MRNPLFTGVCTALVTPFINGQVNYPMLDQLITRQIDAGIKSIVIAGTTGESATLTDEEKYELFCRSKKVAGDKCCIIAGTGSNNTEHSILLSKAAQKAGVDALLIVSPYYNKATPEGTYLHYLSISHAVSLPIIIYNVPSRTGLDIPVSVYQRLSQIPNIAGVKEASPDITKIARIINQCGNGFHVWSGNDEQIVPAVSLGAKGAISVLSNLYPLESQYLCEAALNGDFDTAADLQRKMLPLIDFLFCEVNPIPVKAAMQYIGFDCGSCRLPLSSLTAEHIQTMRELLS